MQQVPVKLCTRMSTHLLYGHVQESKWTMPDELKKAMEDAGKAEDIMSCMLAHIAGLHNRTSK